MPYIEIYMDHGKKKLRPTPGQGSVRPDWNIQGSRAIRERHRVGAVFTVPELMVMDGYYRARGEIVPLRPLSDELRPARKPSVRAKAMEDAIRKTHQKRKKDKLARCLHGNIINSLL